jgi:formyltetrahydrofolate deformylase
VVIFVSRAAHCLYDLLLAGLSHSVAQVVAVVSNHPDLRPVADHFAVPFHHIPVSADKVRAEEQQVRLLEELGAELIVLARYMQILSPAFVARWPGAIINIHHSLLPAFIGARPYHQAHQRGVKLIGATAHYVTDELDQGPIIEQDVCRITHRDGVDQLLERGHALERQVLTRAVRWHLENRVVIAGNRTIVFG